MNIYGLGTQHQKGSNLELRFDKEATFDHVVIQEDIQHSERVRHYTLEILKNKQWCPLETGVCIGHKRIHVLPSQTAQGVRLIVDESIATPLIKKLAVY